MVSGLMAPKRRRKPCRGAQEDAALASAQWAGLKEQTALQQRNHSPEENAAARRRTLELLSGGWSAVDWA